MEKETAIARSRLNPAWRHHQEFLRAWEKCGRPTRFAYTFKDGIGKRVMDINDLQANLDEKINPSKALKGRRAYLQQKYGKKRGK